MALQHSIHKLQSLIFIEAAFLHNQIANMVNSKRFLEMARKWQRLAAQGKRRITWSRSKTFRKFDAATASVADKGHFIVYSAEGRRFMVPLAYLNSKIFMELLRMAEEVFGLPHDNPITLPCDASFLENILFFLQKQGRKDVEREYLSAVSNHRSTSSSYFSLLHNQQLAVGAF